MAEHTSSSITIEAAPADVMAVIADFARYPDWTGEVKEAEVLATDDHGRAEKVRLVMDAGAIKDDQTLGYTWTGDHEVSWTLVKSQMLRSLDGLPPQARGHRRTEVTYQLTVDVKIPMLGMIKRKAEKVIIDRALAGLKKRVESGESISARPAFEDERVSAYRGAGAEPSGTGTGRGGGGETLSAQPAGQAPVPFTYMRTILITGPGGSGRTTVAAATALEASRRGTRTLVLTADRTDTLGAALGTPTGGTAHRGRPGPHHLAAGRHRGLPRRTSSRSRTAPPPASTCWAPPVWTARNSPPCPAPRNSPCSAPCATRATPDTYDLLVVDLPPTPQALALLALPEQLRRYLRRLLPAERQAARALRPVLGRLAGVPMPSEWLYETAARWDVELAAVQLAVEDAATTVRLVAEPGPAGTDAVRTAATGLALRGLRTDALVANRVLPDASPDTWLAALAVQQRKALDEWRDEWGRTSDVREIPHLGRDPRGAEDLAALPVPAPGDAPGPVEWPVVDRLADDGVLVWHIPLPGAIREELDLVRRGDELVVTAGQFRRIVPLPSALRRCTVDGASLRDGELAVRFAPDPDLWPRGR